jgi:hypothetical protein
MADGIDYNSLIKLAELKIKDEEQYKKIIKAIREISKEYRQDQSVAICISKWDNEKFAEYPWNKCISDQVDRGYSVKTAERICGWIKAQNQ